MAKAAANTKAEPPLFLPGPEVWELWKKNGDGRFRREEVTEMTAASPAAVPGGVRFTYPVLTSFAVPFWASTDDPALLDEVCDMQLEKLGLKPANTHGKLREYHVVDTIGTRSLAVATVLAPVSRVEFPKQAPMAFQVSPYLYPLPDDSVTIWKELGRLVLAVTRNDSPVYFHALPSDRIDQATIQEIKCILLQLKSQEVIEGVEQVVFWLGTKRDTAAMKLVEDGLGVTAKFAEIPAPDVPKIESQLLPEEVAIIRDRQAARRRLKSRLLIGTFIYLLLIGLFAGRLLLTRQKAAELHAEIQLVEPAAAAIRETRLRWEMLRPAINADIYPLELLSKCAQILPQRGVRLTEFLVNGENIHLKGEASSASEALRFKGDLMNKPLFADYEWAFPQPTILQTGGATFQTKGTPKYGRP